MSGRKKLAFAAITVMALLVVVEGVGWIVWRVFEARAFAARGKLGEEALRNDSINFMKVADGRYGYTLKPGFASGGTVINPQGFAQREIVPVERRPGTGTLRLIAMGESTTQGLPAGNYPDYLRALLKLLGSGYGDVEIINAGVAGWVSDQLALRAEEQLALYKPDVVVLYAGWNDLQSYDPYGPPATRSIFEIMYGTVPPGERLGLKSVVLLSAAVTALRAQSGASTPATAPPAPERPSITDHYRFYLASLDRIVTAFREGDPRVRIAIGTLVGRWPQGTLQDFTDGKYGRTYWMKTRKLTPGEAAQSLRRFNDLIRQYAKARGLILIDAEAAFANLDRGTLQYDFAHMHAEGYELLAELMYDGLVRAGAVTGAPSPRRDVLLQKYALTPAPVSP